jgi:hypothetical protein
MKLPDLIFPEPCKILFITPIINLIKCIILSIFYFTTTMLRKFFALLLFDVVNLIVTSSVTSQFEESWTFCYTYFHFIKDTKSSWTNVGDKIMYINVTVNNFKGQYAVFFMLDKWMVDVLTILICIAMKLFCEFISFLWNRVMNAGKVLLCDKWG